MGNHKYYYNPETCQYEPVPFKPWGVISYGFMLLISSIILFTAIIFVHGRIFNTEATKALRKENRALSTHEKTLRQDLQEVQASLINLKQLDEGLYQKLFDSPQEEVNASDKIRDEDILLADASNFRTILGLLDQKSDAIRYRASVRDQYNAQSISTTREEVEDLMKLPVRQPVDNPELNRLVSGFGLRINPYHKGNYQHDGADFTAPRGSSVFATGPGRISNISLSSIEAGYGNYIDIDHGNGIVTRYAHLDEINVRQGQKVEKGTIIGTVGMTGGTVAPHVHYEVIRNGVSVDPVMYMMEGLTAAQYTMLQQLGRKKNQSLD